MPRTTTSTKKTTTAKRVASVSINFRAPAEPAAAVKVKKGSTLADLIEDRNLDGYVVSLNGSTTVSKETVLAKDDVVRIGIKTKNN